MDLAMTEGFIVAGDVRRLVCGWGLFGVSVEMVWRSTDQVDCTNRRDRRAISRRADYFHFSRRSWEGN